MVVVPPIGALVATRYYEWHRRKEEQCKKCKYFKGWYDECEKDLIPKNSYVICPYNDENE